MLTGRLRTHVLLGGVALAALLAWAALTLAPTRAAEPPAPPAVKPFTVALLPDPQGYTEFYPKRFTQQTQWLVDHRRERNIVFVSMLGDIVQNFSKRKNEWRAATQAMNLLHKDGDPAKEVLIPYGMAIGNHDYDRKQWIRGTKKANIVLGAKTWLKHFGPIRFRDKGFGWYGGDDLGFRHEGAVGVGLNTYQYFRGGGRTFLHICLELGGPEGGIAWIESLLAMEKHRQMPTIISTHAYMDGAGTKLSKDRMWRRDVGNTGQAIWERLFSKHRQIFMVVCGHTGIQQYLVEKNAFGQDVHTIMVCYTAKRIPGDKHRNGAGWMNLLEFQPAQKRIHFRTYSPTLDKWATNRGGEPKTAYPPNAYDDNGKLKPGKQSDFYIDFDLLGRFPLPRPARSASPASRAAG